MRERETRWTSRWYRDFSFAFALIHRVYRLKIDSHYRALTVDSAIIINKVRIVCQTLGNVCQWKYSIHYRNLNWFLLLSCHFYLIRLKLPTNVFESCWIRNWIYWLSNSEVALSRDYHTRWWWGRCLLYERVYCVFAIVERHHFDNYVTKF